VRTEQDPDRLLRSFLGISLDITRDLDIGLILAGIVERAMEVTGATYGAAVTLSNEGQLEDFLHRGLEPEKVALLPHLPEGKGLLGFVLEAREPVRISKISDHPRSIGFPSEHVEMEALLGLPIEHRGELIGALYLTKPAGVMPFSEDDEVFTQAIAAMAAVAIDNARLLSAETSRAERAALLRNIASKVRRSLDVQEVLDATVDELGRAAGVDRCLIRLVSETSQDPALGSIASQWTSGALGPITEESGYSFPVSYLALRTRSTQWTEDLSEDERLLRLARAERDSITDSRGVLSTPLEWGDQLLGVVTLGTILPRDWSISDRALVEAVAREVAIAIHHAKLYEEAVQTAERLRELDEMRSDFISMVSHELRSPMTVVAGIADILAKRRHKLSDERQSELIGTLGREARRLTRLVSEVLDLEAIDQGQMELHPSDADLAALGAESIADAGEAHRTKLIVEPGNATVFGDYDKIKQVLLNLISNAAKFSNEDAAIAVTIAPDKDFVTISVTDEGPGIPEEHRPRLFQRFSRVVATGQRKPGSGLGLYLARIIVEGHNGTIWCDSIVDVGTTFSFRLPRNSIAESG
jgi:signal transduction histidine kinase